MFADYNMNINCPECGNSARIAVVYPKTHEAEFLCRTCGNSFTEIFGTRELQVLSLTLEGYSTKDAKAALLESDYDPDIALQVLRDKFGG